MANLNAILKNKMGLSVEQAKKSKILASLSGSYRQNMKSIHYSQLVPSTNQFYTEKGTGRSGRYYPNFGRGCPEPSGPKEGCRTV